MSRLFERVYIASKQGINFTFPSIKDDEYKKRVEPFLFADNNVTEQIFTFAFCLTSEISDRLYATCRRLNSTAMVILTKEPNFSLFEKILKAMVIRKRASFRSFLNFLKHLWNQPNIDIIHMLVTGNPVEEYLFTSPDSGSDFSLGSLLSSLDSKRLFCLFASILNERRLLFSSSSLETLTKCIWASLNILKPFEWKSILIPVIPSQLIDTVNAPTPYIIGVHNSLISTLETMRLSDLVFIDLDNNRIEGLDPVDLAIIPSILSTKIIRGIKRIQDQWKRSGSLDLFDAIQTFNNFFLSLFQNASEFYINKAFDLDGFLLTKSKKERKFLNVFQNTQMFESWSNESKNFDSKINILNKSLSSKRPKTTVYLKNPIQLIESTETQVDEDEELINTVEEVLFDQPSTTLKISNKPMNKSRLTEQQIGDDFLRKLNQRLKTKELLNKQLFRKPPISSKPQNSSSSSRQKQNTSSRKSKKLLKIEKRKALKRRAKINQNRKKSFEFTMDSSVLQNQLNKVRGHKIKEREMKKKKLLKRQSSLIGQSSSGKRRTISSGTGIKLINSRSIDNPESLFSGKRNNNLKRRSKAEIQNEKRRNGIISEQNDRRKVFFKTEPILPKSSTSNSINSYRIRKTRIDSTKPIIENIRKTRIDSKPKEKIRKTRIESKPIVEKTPIISERERLLAELRKPVIAPQKFINPNTTFVKSEIVEEEEEEEKHLKIENEKSFSAESDISEECINSLTNTTDISTSISTTSDDEEFSDIEDFIIDEPEEPDLPPEELDFPEINSPNLPDFPDIEPPSIK